MPAISGSAFLQTPHYIVNVVTAIINEQQKLWLPDIMEFALSTFRTQNFITFLAWYFPGYCINRPALCMKVFDFCLSWSLASVKSMWFKTFMSECGLKDWKISLLLKWKIRSVMEWKCSENINSPSGDQYRIFTHILQK